MDTYYQKEDYRTEVALGRSVKLKALGIGVTRRRLEHLLVGNVVGCKNNTDTRVCRNACV